MSDRATVHGDKNLDGNFASNDNLLLPMITARNIETAGYFDHDIELVAENENHKPVLPYGSRDELKSIDQVGQ